MTPDPIPLPISYLHECFTYEPHTGRVVWNERPRHHFKSDMTWRRFNQRTAGREAGCKQVRYGRNHCVKMLIRYTGGMWQQNATVLIYALMGVAIPSGMLVDHKDCNPFNNRWDNLRLATTIQNSRNRKRNRNRISTLPKGVYKVKVKGAQYRASIRHHDKYINLGRYNTVSEASNAYNSAAQILFGEFANPSS